MGGTSEMSSQLLPYWEGNSVVSLISRCVGGAVGSNNIGNNGSPSGSVDVAVSETVVEAEKSAIAPTALVMKFLRRLGSR